MDELNSKHFTSRYLKTNSFGVSSHKLMIVMHGLGDQLDSYVSLVKEINVTGINYLLINAPRPYPVGYSWYDLPPADPKTGINESLELLKKLIGELLDKGFAYEDLLLMGFSQGGAMAIELGNSLDKKLGGVLALSPRIYMDPNQLTQGFKDTPFFASHGKFDSVIPFNQTHEALMQMKPQVRDFTFSAHDMEHEICFDEIIELRNWLNERI